MKKTATLAAICLVVAGVAWAFFEFVVFNRVPAELVGTWVVADGPQEGATFEFHRSGKMIGHVNQNGKLAVIDAQIRVDGAQIHSTTRHPQTGQSKTTVQTIRALTESELVLDDERGGRVRLRRAN